MQLCAAFLSTFDSPRSCIASTLWDTCYPKGVIRPGCSLMLLTKQTSGSSCTRRPAISSCWWSVLLASRRMIANARQKRRLPNIVVHFDDGLIIATVRKARCTRICTARLRPCLLRAQRPLRPRRTALAALLRQAAATFLLRALPRAIALRGQHPGKLPRSWLVAARLCRRQAMRCNLPPRQVMREVCCLHCCHGSDDEAAQRGSRDALLSGWWSPDACGSRCVVDPARNEPDCHHCLSFSGSYGGARSLTALAVAWPLYPHVRAANAGGRQPANTTRCVAVSSCIRV